MHTDVPQLLELKQITDDFSTGCGKVEIVGSCARFYFYADQESLGSGGQERVLVRKLVMPIEFVPAVLRAMADGIHAAPGNHPALAKEMLLNRGWPGH